jgi:hypothetical protein
MSKGVAIMEVHNLMDLFGVCWGEGMSEERGAAEGMKGKE